MRFMPTRIHGFLDYIIGILLLLSPWIFQFQFNTVATAVPVTLGIAAVIYSLLTRYESGVLYVLPMKTHLMLDFLSGLLLALSPWIFGFAGSVYLPHLILGIVEMLAAVSTRTAPGARFQQEHMSKVSHA